ncbi:MAG: hypothetical protein OQJ97_15065 [Rhodospirillales bacterium]|nr:hypothetical protein [Rhodospirillales bacterium]
MRAVLSMAETGSRSLSFLLGILVLGLAIAVGTTSLDPSSIAAWALKVFGVTFILLIGGLVFTALFSWVRYCQAQKYDGGQVWLETGMHAANGVSTVALTYTLLGISMGIGTLADQQLNPETVQIIIAGLTEHFSLAFLTSVIGLPLAAALRALLMITEARCEKENKSCVS